MQNSVFEVNLDYGNFLKVKSKLLNAMDSTQDSLRFYYLGNNWKNKVEHIGVKEGYDSEGFLMV